MAVYGLCLVTLTAELDLVNETPTSLRVVIGLKRVYAFPDGYSVALLCRRKKDYCKTEEEVEGRCVVPGRSANAIKLIVLKHWSVALIWFSLAIYTSAAEPRYVMLI